MNKLKAALKNEEQLTFVQKVDDVLFSHAGVTEWFVRSHFEYVDYDNVDQMVKEINKRAFEEGASLMRYDDSSPIWVRPQQTCEKMYQEDNILQVVGHTPMRKVTLSNNTLSCDVFSTYPDGSKYGNEMLAIVDTENKTWEEVK